MLPLCRAEGIGVIPWSPLARGRLTRDWDASQRARRDRRLRQDALRARPPTPTARWSRRWPRSPARLGRPRAQVALAWVLQKPEVSAPIVGATRLEQLDDAVAALSLAARAGGHRRARGAVRAARGGRPHLTCGRAAVPALALVGAREVNSSLAARGTAHSARGRCFPTLTPPTVFVSEPEKVSGHPSTVRSRKRHEPEAHPLSLHPRRGPGRHRQRRARRRTRRQPDPRRSQGQRPRGARQRPAPSGRRSDPAVREPQRHLDRSRTARCATRPCSPAPTASSSPPAKARRTWPRPARRWPAPTSRKRRARRASTTSSFPPAKASARSRWWPARRRSGSSSSPGGAERRGDVARSPCARPAPRGAGRVAMPENAEAGGPAAPAQSVFRSACPEQEAP